ncbi:MAG: PQQ-binding-like beta-propeller repeat protein, partial [Planctomycetota bacterium]
MSKLRSTTMAISLMMALAVQALGDDWVRFRGPNGSGISAEAVPVEFGPGENIAWETDLPGRGVSSPIVVGDKVFVTCYSGYGMTAEDPGELEDLERHLVCIDRGTGDVLWTAVEPAQMPEDPYTGAGVPAHGYASHTPTTDGERIYVFYGKSGVFAYDFEGNRLWHTMVGQESGPRRWGSSSSPILYGDTLIVMASDESETLYGLDTTTGDVQWKSEAEGYAGVWGTPVLAEGRKGTEILVAVPDETWAVNADTGKFSWYAPGNGGGSHSLVLGDDVAYSVGGSRGGAAAVAVKLGGKGEVEDVIWESRASSRFATPILFDGYIFSVANNQVRCFNAETGEEIYREKLPEKFASESTRSRGRFGNQSYASPVIANGNLYITDVSGTVYVVAAKPEIEVLAKNDLTADESGFHA